MKAKIIWTTAGVIALVVLGLLFGAEEAKEMLNLITGLGGTD